MNKLEQHRKQIRQEFKNCRTLYEVYRINIGLLQEYPEWLINQERCRRVLEFTVDKIYKNRRSEDE